MPDVPIAESSPAPVAEPVAPRPIESWTQSEYQEWRQTGKTPEPVQPKTAESAPATESPEPPHEEVEPAPASEPDVKQEPPAPKKKGAEERKAELAGEIQELLRQRAELRKEIAPKPKVETPAEPAAKEGRPKGNDFATWEEYQEAVIDWKVSQAREADKAEAEKKRADEEQKTVAESWNAKVKKLSEAHPDFAEVVSAADVAFPPVLQGAVVRMESGPEVVYHLATNLDEARRIAALPVELALIEIGKISASLAKPAPETPKITRASKPVTEVAAKATAPPDEASAALKDRDFARYRRIMNSRETTSK